MSIRINKETEKKRGKVKKASVGRKRAYSQIAKWSKTISNMCCIYIVGCVRSTCKKGPQIRKDKYLRGTE